MASSIDREGQQGEDDGPGDQQALDESDQPAQDVVGEAQPALGQLGDEAGQDRRRR